MLPEQLVLDSLNMHNRPELALDCYKLIITSATCAIGSLPNTRDSQAPQLVSEVILESSNASPPTPRIGQTRSNRGTLLL